jgi:hypothetical protein
MIEIYVEFLAFVIVLGLFMWVFHGPRRRLVLAEQRTRLFEIRESLWEQANAGVFDKGRGQIDDCPKGPRPAGFDDDAYKIVRHTINGTINQLEHLTFWSAMVLVLQDNNPKMGHRFRLRFETALSGHSETAQETLRYALDEANAAVLWSVIQRSMVLLSITYVVKAVSRLVRRWTELRSFMLHSSVLWRLDSAITKAASDAGSRPASTDVNDQNLSTA